MSAADLEARALACARLLLDGHDLHDLVLERGAQERLHDLVLLHREREQVDLLQALDLALRGKHGHTIGFFVAQHLWCTS